MREPDEDPGLPGAPPDVVVTGVRPARASDVAIADVQRSAWGRRRIAPAPADQPPSDRHWVLVALDGAAVVGFAAYAPSPDHDREPTVDAELLALSVRPRAARHGHGSRLLTGFTYLMRADGFTIGLVWVRHEGRQVQRFLGPLVRRPTARGVTSTPEAHSWHSCAGTWTRGDPMTFPDEALEFYVGLEADNTKTYWTAHREVYERCVRAPMQALLDALEPEFGPGAMFRPYRDVRFSRDKAPYKTHQGAVVGAFYVQVSATGVLVASGYHQTTPDQVDRLRAAVADDVTGPAVERLLRGLREDGFAVEGERLKTRPRGYPVDHPRIELLRFRTLVASRALDGPGSVEEVRAAWRRMRPLTEWLDQYVGPARG